MLISSSLLPGFGRVSAKNVNKLTDFNAAVSSLGNVGRRKQDVTIITLDVARYIYCPS